MKIEMLRVFVETVRAGNLAGAAEVLHKAPSAISMTLKQLEDHLGQPLFEAERKSRLTPLGHHTFDMAVRELDHFERTKSAIMSYAKAQAGEVRLAAVPSFAVAMLPELIAAFRSMSPNIKIDIRDLDSATIQRELERERIDLGIVSDARPESEIEHTTLTHDQFGVVMRNDDPLACNVDLTWQDVAGTRLIANPLCERLDQPDLRQALADASLRIHNTSTLLAMVAGGMGVTILPAMVCRRPMADITFKRLSGPAISRSIDLITRARETPSPATLAFKSFLLQRLDCPS